MSVVERDDATFVTSPGYSYSVGFNGVTAIKIVARHGPMDWIPYVEVWEGDRPVAEMPQHQTELVEFGNIGADGVQS